MDKKISEQLKAYVNVYEHSELRCVICGHTSFELKNDGCMHTFAPVTPYMDTRNGEAQGICSDCVSKILYAYPALFTKVLSDTSFKGKLKTLFRAEANNPYHIDTKETTAHLEMNDGFIHSAVSPNIENIMHTVFNIIGNDEAAINSVKELMKVHKQQVAPTRISVKPTSFSYQGNNTAQGINTRAKTTSTGHDSSKMQQLVDENAQLRRQLNHMKNSSKIPNINPTVREAAIHATTPPTPTLTPKEIIKRLDQFVVGQEDAKKTLAIAATNHYKRINNPDTFLEKDNVMMLGPTGSGKTHLLKTLANIVDLPFVIADANSLTVAGYVGQDIESMLSQLYQKADQNLEKAQHGIIFIDEIDKIASKPDENSAVSSVGVQQALLKMIEGGNYEVPEDGNTKGTSGTFLFDTSNILFIVGGAFVGLENIVNGPVIEKKRGLGFTAIDDTEPTPATPTAPVLTKKHIREFGLIPEFLGRISHVTQLHILTEDDLYRILVEPKNSITQSYINAFEMDDIHFEFSEEALRHIAHLAYINDEGARSLKTIMAQSMKDLQLTLPGSGLRAYMMKIDDVKKDINE